MSKKTALNDEQKQKSLELCLKQLNKEFGQGSVMKLGEKEVVNIPSISTGSIAIDLALGIGGIPQGRVVEVYGPESSGKTTLTLQTIAEAQKKGMICAFIDAEHALDPIYAKNLGVDTDNLIISQPNSGEEALDIVEGLLNSGAVGLIVIDSVSALVPRVELDGDMGQSHVGIQARLMSQALRKLTPSLQKNNTTLFFINQIRMKIGTMGYGSPETTSGGNALKFFASVRIDIRRIGSVKAGEDVIGNRTKCKIVKNKVAPPFKQVEFDVIFGKGIDKIREIIDYGVKFDVIEKSGAWFSYGPTSIGQGKEKVVLFLEENPDILVEIEGKIMEHLIPKDVIKKETENSKESTTKKTTKK